MRRVLPLPILVALGLVGAWLVFTPASPTSPFQGTPGGAGGGAPPSPPPPSPGASVNPTTSDAVPPFVSGTGSASGWGYPVYGSVGARHHRPKRTPRT